MTIREALQHGLDNIRTYGWIQGDLGKPEEGFCAIGALPYGCLLGPARRALAAPIDVPYRGLADWNDAPERTVDDVVGLYLRAIEAQPTHTNEEDT